MHPQPSQTQHFSQHKYSNAPPYHGSVRRCTQQTHTCDVQELPALAWRDVAALPICSRHKLDIAQRQDGCYHSEHRLLVSLRNAHRCHGVHSCLQEDKVVVLLVSICQEP